MNTAQAVLEWIRDKDLRSHATSNAAIVEDLRNIGINVTGKKGYYQLELNGQKATCGYMTWQEKFEAIKFGSIAFVLIKPDKESDKVEYFTRNTDRKITTFDEDGNPKTKADFYAVVKHKEQAQGVINMGAGWLYDTPEERAVTSISDGNLVEALCHVLGGTPKSAMGRGFRFDNCIDEIARIAKENVNA